MNAIYCAIALGIACSALPVAAQTAAPDASTHAGARRDGSHDFDWEIGAWQTHLTRLVYPLTGSKTWVEYNGLTVVRKVWGGGSNLVELDVDGSAGHIQALSLRLYNPATGQWSLNFANSKVGALSLPSQVGEFTNGRGMFYDQEALNDRMILVRFIISDITANSARFEQAYSDDAGETWETNWIATDTRVATPTQEKQ